MPAWLQSTPAGVVVALYVQPRASRNEIVGEQGDALKVRLTSPPVDGAANKLCCEFVARCCGVPKRDVTLLAGERSRQKRLLVRGGDVKAIELALSGKN